MTWTQGEFTGDGTVDINDLTIVLAHYGADRGRRRPRAWPPCPSRARWLLAAALVGIFVAYRSTTNEYSRPAMAP